MELTETTRADVLQVDQLVEEFHLSRRAARKLARELGVRLGRRTLIARPALLSYLERRAGEAAKREEE